MSDRSAFYQFANWFKYIPRDVIDESLLAYDIKGCVKIFEDADMLDTAIRFFENDLNVCRTARAMFMHRNTLNYRLNKIAEETGLDIRSFQDALSFISVYAIYLDQQENKL